MSDEEDLERAIAQLDRIETRNWAVWDAMHPWVKTEKMYAEVGAHKAIDAPYKATGKVLEHTLKDVDEDNKEGPQHQKDRDKEAAEMEKLMDAAREHRKLAELHAAKAQAASNPQAAKMHAKAAQHHAFATRQIANVAKARMLAAPPHTHEVASVWHKGIHMQHSQAEMVARSAQAFASSRVTAGIT